MTPANRRPALAAGWPDALARGLVAFLAMAGIGQALALGVWAVADTGASFAAAARIGWIYFGAFHHVAIELDVPDLDVTASVAGPGATSISIGVALLSITAIAAWLLFRGGRAVADRAGGGTRARLLHGAKVAPSYALPAFALASIVDVRTPFRLGSFASGELHVALSTGQALVFPLAIAAAAGAAGGLRSALDARAPGDHRLERMEAAASGGWSMFVAGVALSLAGLFVAGVVQPEGPAALLTPSTARYYRAVFDRPAAGAVGLGHHLALLPNEAIWTLVPAMGGCDGVRGSASEEFLCYVRFPTAVGTTLQPLTGDEGVPVPFGEAEFGAAPAWYLLFLLVPAAATVLGGRRAAERLGVVGREGARAGARAGLVFAVLVAFAALLSTVTVGYGAAFGEEASGGWLLVGPNLPTGTLLALAWGVGGGGLGGATTAWVLRPRPSSPSSR